MVLLHPNLTLTQKLNNSQVHICHLVFPVSPPILLLNEFVLHNDQACQKIGSAGRSVVAGGFEPGGIGKFSVVAAVHPVLECVGCSVEDAVNFVNHHPSLLLCFYKWGSLVPIHTSPSASEFMVAWGIAAS